MWLVSPGCADPDRELPREYRRVEIPVSRMASEDAQQHGEQLFLEYCSLCHGERGDGRGIRREGLTRAPRDFTNPAWRQSTSPRRIFHAIREGVPSTPMPGWKALSEQDAWDMTTYVLSLGDAR
jgi:mono/diheme cytochrome c family protein